MNNFLNSRMMFALAAIACGAVLAFAFYLQYMQEMEPCPLCWFQRLAVLGLAITFTMGAFAGAESKAAKRIAIAATLMALAGAAVAARHIWIQNLPADQVPACGQGISYMLENMPFLDVFAKAIKGSGECAKRDTWIGLTLPTWTIILFFCLTAWAWIAARRAPRSKYFS